LSSILLAGGVALWLVTVDNVTFWRTFAAAQTASLSAVAATLAVAMVLWLTATTLLWWLAPFRLAKPMSAVLLLTSALAAHFVDNWGVLLDKHMMRNVVQTDVREAADLMNGALLLDFLVRGVLPAGIVLMIRLRPVAPREWFTRGAALLGITGLTVGAALAAFYPLYASTFRNHRELRLQLVPSNYLGGLYAVLRPQRRTELELVATDAKRIDGRPRPLLVVLVVGETARADNFSLGGYPRPTNEALAGKSLVYFSQVTSCGTDTATSLPCMFSDVGAERFSADTSGQRENLLDVLQRAGVEVSWIENNSGCKEVCKRVPTSTVQDKACGTAIECFDEALVPALIQKISSSSKDALVVMHQRGSHGPAYYKRYPAPARFTPTCESNRLQECDGQALINTYDNTIDYTSRVLARTIDQLAEQPTGRDVLLIYVSDHGESLGERGVYLHGMPRWMAPHEQFHVPMLMWISAGAQQTLAPEMNCLKTLATQPASHDNLFHTLLGAFGVQTGIYRPELDLLAAARGLRACQTPASADPAPHKRPALL
jgi:lipid A ethanolaminephosphotransferase